MATTLRIPSIDLADYASGSSSRSQMIRTLGEGLREFGFLNVSGRWVRHG